MVQKINMILTNGSSTITPIIPISLSNNSPAIPVNNRNIRVNSANRFCLSSIYGAARKSCG